MTETHQFQIWQVRPGPAYAKERFLNTRQRMELDLPIKKAHYMMVWAATEEGSEDVDVLEALYERFNIYAPIDYRGRMMSVSDIVVLDGNRAYYCDSIGWSRVKEWED